MGEYRDGVVWNKVSLFSLMHSCCCLVFSACSLLVFAPSLPHACCSPHSHCCPLLLVSFHLPPSQYIEGQQGEAAGKQGAEAGQQRRGGEGQRQMKGKQCSRPAAAVAAVAAEEVSTAAVGSGGLEGRLGVVWCRYCMVQVCYGKLIPSSVSSPFSLQAEGGSTGARAGEWSPPSHSPPPLSLLHSLPAAPCMDHRGVSPSPNPPFSLHFPAASASWRSARLW
ncbi:unnamed protein product [Closterium sp. NIES-54]